MLKSDQKFDEIRVFEGVAERTGNTVDRKTIRGSKSLCRSLTDLTRTVRRLGDGYFYLPVMMWPEGQNQLELISQWTVMS